MKKYPTPPSDELNMQSALKFTRLASKMSTLLKEEGIPITFEGMTDTLNEYFAMQENDAVSAFEVAKLSSLWFNYLSEVEHIVDYAVGNTLTEVDKMKATLVPDTEYMIHENKIKELTLKYQSLRLFCRQIRGKKRFFIGAYFHSMRVYQKAVDNFIYKKQYD